MPNPVSEGLSGARLLRRELGLENLQPADPFAVAASLGIVLVRRPLAERAMAGAYLYLPEAAQGFILVNASDVLTRQRFTAAHEIAHSIFDQNSTVVDDLTAPNSIEKRANAFAAEFLLPEKAAIGWKPQQPWGTDVNDVAALAAQYGLSFEATLWRLKSCGLLESVDDLKGRAAEITFELRAKLAMRLEEHLDLPREFLRMLDEALASDVISRKRFDELRGVSDEVEIAF